MLTVADGAACAVIIPVFNQAHFLSKAIESCLAQTVPPSEIIVVDDGSDDDPASVATQFKQVRFIRQRNRGPSAARNTGIRAASAIRIIFLDADDLLLPQALEQGLGSLAANPDAVLTFGGFRVIDENGAPLSPSLQPIGSPDDAYDQLLRRGNFIGMLAAILFRRVALDAVGGFDERLRLCEDYELYLRLAQGGRFAAHDGLVAEYRRHEASASSDRFALLAAALKVLNSQGQGSKRYKGLTTAIRQGRIWWRSYYAEEIALNCLRRIQREGVTAQTCLLLGRALTLAPLRLTVRLGAFGIAKGFRLRPFADRVRPNS